MRQIGFFPGKFQPPHIGHVLTISKLMKEYDIIIGISPDDPRVVSQYEVKKTFKLIFEDRVRYYIFDRVFTDYITMSNFPDFDILLTGNDKVITWADELNIRAKKILRTQCIGGNGEELRKL